MRAVEHSSRLLACWSVKGGSGTSVVAAALGILVAQQSPEEVLLVDLGDDLPTVFGLDRHIEQGAGSRPDESDALDSLISSAVEVSPRLRLVPRGLATTAEGMSRFVEAVLSRPISVVVDCGPPGDELGVVLAAAAPTSLLVMRPCFLALRRAAQASVRPTGVIVVREPGRMLRSRDIAESMSFPDLTEVPWDPTISRAVDAGTLGKRLPRQLAKALLPLVATVQDSPAPTRDARNPIEEGEQ